MDWTPKHNIAAASLTLAADELQQLEEASSLSPEYQGWMVEGQAVGRRSA